MKAFYTIIKIASNTIAGDTLSIGLLLHNGTKFWLQFSDEKKNVAKRLLNNNQDIVEYVAKQIEQKVGEMNARINESVNDLFAAENILNSSDFKHISHYSNGVLRFTEPAFLNDSVTDEKFQKLFTLLIDQNPQKAKFTTDEKDNILKQRIEQKLINRVANKVHTNFNLTPEKIIGLHYNFNIDCIGLNGSFIAAKSIPFHKKYETIDKEISHYMSLVSILKLSYSRTDIYNDHFYIIGDEPTVIDSKEHRTWEILKNNPTVKLLYSEEADKVAVEIEEKNATTFLEL